MNIPVSDIPMPTVEEIAAMPDTVFRALSERVWDQLDMIYPNCRPGRPEVDGAALDAAWRAMWKVYPYFLEAWDWRINAPDTEALLRSLGWTPWLIPPPDEENDS